MIKEDEDVTVSWNQSAHTNREVMANRVDKIVKNETKKNIHTGRFGSTADRNITQTGAEKSLKFVYRYTANGRSQWPCGLRRRSSAARLLRSWVRIPPKAWMFVL